MRCESCGHPNPDTARFCNGCGGRLRAALAGAPDGERRQLTVMFCDLVDSTALSNEMDAEDYRELVRTYQESAGVEIERYGGHVSQYLGDGILVLFGFPVAQEDDAERALRASLDIVRSVEGENDAVEHRWGVRLAVRVGVHTGPVVVGEMGHGEQREMQALGATLNLAARLQAVAAPGTVAASAATLALAPGMFRTRDLGTPALKGVPEPIGVHRVLDVTGVRGRLDANPRALTPLVGRERELAALLDEWRRVQQGEQRALAVAGEAGVGKSRLVRELRRRLDAVPHEWLECRTTPRTAEVPFYPLLDALGAALTNAADDTAEGRVDRLVEGLETDGLVPREVVPILAPMLTLPVPDGYPPPPPSAELLHKKAAEAMLDWVRARSLRQPLVFVVEDLHWCDVWTLDLLGSVLEAGPSLRAFVVFTYRPEFEMPWREPRPVVMALAGLDADASREVVGAVAGDRALPDALRQQIVERGEGIPLFLEELTKTLVESDDPGGAADIPSTLRDSLAARLDRLEVGKRVAQLASVVGRRFSEEVLRAASDLDDDVVSRGLRELLDGELVFRRADDSTEFIFKHALVQGVAYDSLLRTTRRRVHRRIAEAFEARPADRAAPAAVLAHHWEAADDPVRAAHWRNQVALGLGYHSSALDHWHHARRLLGEAPTSPEVLALRVEVCGEILTMSARSGRQDLDAIHRECRQASEESGRPELEFRYLRDSGYARFMGGFCEEGLGTLRRAESVMKQLDDPSLFVGLYASMIQAIAYCGPLPEAIAGLRRFLEGMKTHGGRAATDAIGRMRTNTAPTLSFLGFWETEAGDVDGGRARHEEALALATELEDPGPRAIVYFHVAHARTLLGEPADDLVDTLFELAEADDAPAIVRGACFGSAAGIARARGDPDEAIALYERCDRAGVPSIRLYYRPWLALAHLERGDADAALGVARTMADETHRSGARVREIPALLILAHVLGRRGEVAEKVAKCVGEADRLIDEVGAPFYRDHLMPRLGLQA